MKWICGLLSLFFFSHGMHDQIPHKAALYLPFSQRVRERTIKKCMQEEFASFFQLMPHEDQQVKTFVEIYTWVESCLQTQSNMISVKTYINIKQYELAFKKNEELMRSCISQSIEFKEKVEQISFYRKKKEYPEAFKRCVQTQKRVVEIIEALITEIDDFKGHYLNITIFESESFIIDNYLDDNAVMHKVTFSTPAIAQKMIRKLFKLQELNLLLNCLCKEFTLLKLVTKT